MSIALLKKSIAIVEDLPKKSKINEIQTPTDKKKKSRVLDRHIHMGVGQFKQRNDKQKQNIVDIRTEINLNSKRADENVKKLLNLSRNTVRIANAEIIIKRAHKGRYMEKVDIPKVEQESIFTEEDFVAFEKEYFHS